MRITRRSISYILVSTILSIFLMLTSAAELISWSEWARDLTAGMSMVGVTIFNYAPSTRLITTIVIGLISIFFAKKGLSSKYIFYYVSIIIISIILIEYMGSRNSYLSHLILVFYIIILQLPTYKVLSTVGNQYSHKELSNQQILKTSFIWMNIILIFGMFSFYIYYKHPQLLLPLNFTKYGNSSVIYPYLLHFSVLGNFAFLGLIIFFLGKKTASLFKPNYLKLIIEVFIFLFLISFIIHGIFIQLYHEIEITESRYIINLLPIFIPVIFTPIIISLLLVNQTSGKTHNLSTPFSIMYLIASSPLKLFSYLVPEKHKSKYVIGLLLMSIAYFAFSIFLFRGLLFNPWYTILSPIKGLIYAMSVWFGSTLILALIINKNLLSVKISNWAKITGILIVLATSIIIPRKFHQNVGLKGLLIQYSESIKISLDGLKAFYPEYISTYILKSGQGAKVNTTFSISPQAFTLDKKQEAVLNDSVSYVFVLADALRGDFYKGKFTKYDSLYPFMDKWIKEECIWFKNAYSQSNGSYIGIPSLFGSHGNRNILKPSAKNENRFFTFLQKDNVKDIYSIDGDSLDKLFPPETDVISIGKVPEDFDSYDRNVTAMEILERFKLVFKSNSNNQSFFSFFLLMDVHNDLAQKSGAKYYGDKPIDLYAHNINYIDLFMEALISWLKENNRYDNTVIILAADHGEEFKEHESTLHGHNFFEEVMRVPIIMKLPNISAKTIQTPVLNSDIFPTIASLRGYDISSHYGYEHLGINQSNMIINGNEDSSRDMLFISSQNTKHALFRNGRYKMIYWPRYDSFVFYDLIKDPLEYDNLIKENHQLAHEMYNKMLELIMKTSGSDYINTWPKEFTISN